jgi:hypothetical protein
MSDALDMGYLAAWEVLEEMSTDLRKKGATVPAKIMSDLKNAKSLINTLVADPSRIDTVQRIEEYLQSLEVYLVSEGECKFGAEYVEKWLEKLNNAGKKPDGEGEDKTRFVVGAPRDRQWIRVQPTDDLPAGKIETLADESNLTFEKQHDGSLLIYGKDDRLKEFVKKITKGMH